MERRDESCAVKLVRDVVVRQDVLNSPLNNS